MLLIIQILILNLVEANFILNGLNNSYNNDCHNPNGQPGVCISLYYCPTLLRTFLNAPNNSNTEDQKFLQQSTCHNGFGPNQLVCCTNQYTFRDTFPVTTTTGLTHNSLLASPNECTGAYTTYQYGTHVADIKDYHWIAILEYTEEGISGNFTHRCHGSLISHRYILTAAHCVRTFHRKEILRVLLGEYDLSTDIDCVDGFCLGPVSYVDIEKIITHSQYNPNDFQNDIALMRLAKHVDYDKNIAPICLPSTVGFNGSEAGEGLFLAGFDSNRKTTTKIQVNHPIFDQKNCTELHKTFYLNISKKQLCAGGNAEGDDTADSGGALMKRYIRYWVVEGIVSFALIDRPKGVPMVYTRVSEYENWIIENIEP